MIYAFLRGLMRLVVGVYLFGLFRCTGRELVPRSGGLIVCPNHQSTIDPPLVPAYLPRGAPRVARLAEANRRLTLLRILLRGARERHHLSVDQHEHAMKLIDAIGRQIGGWLRRESGGGRAP